MEKLPSILEEVAYRDMWGERQDSYTPWFASVASLLGCLLSDKGSLYVHCDATANHHIRMALEARNSLNFKREIIWQMKSRSGFKSRTANWVRDHDTIFYFTQSSEYLFNTQYEPYSEEYVRKMFKGQDADGRRYRQRANRRYYADESGIPIGDVWTDISSFQTATRSNEYLGYPTQKPEALLERIIKASSNEGNLVLDCFVGSGTTAAVAEKLGRRWIGVDIGRFAIQTTRKRLLDIEGCRPFEVQNLGRYERQYWSGVEAMSNYIDFILNLYKARPMPDQFTYVHGIREGAAVHVGATDAPVSADELRAVVQECVDNGFKSVDVLGWEWEMGLNPALRDELRHSTGVAITLRNIPREILDQRNIDAGGINFFELSVAEASVETPYHMAAQVELTSFIPAVDEYMRQKLTNTPTEWSDWIDYWSVDFEYDGEVFVNQWQSYRTRRDRTLNLRSDPHEYADPGEKHIVVKVIDIFGNDTTLELRCDVGGVA